MTQLSRTLAAAVALAPAAAFAAAEEAPQVPPGDPPGWYEPADTPQKQHDNAMREAAAALDEALAECRRQAAARESCEAEARSRYDDDVERARGYLVPSNLA